MIDDFQIQVFEKYPLLKETNAFILAGMLSLTRTQAFFFLSPIVGIRTIPAPIKFSIYACTIFVASPVVFNYLILNKDEYIGIFGILVLKEIMVGMFLGILIWLPVRGLEIVGVIFDTQRGATSAEVFGVVFNANTTITGNLITQAFAAYLFSSGGFLIILKTMYESFLIVPVGGAEIIRSSFDFYLFLKAATSIFKMALVIALPISGFLFLADIVIAMMAKSAPTLNGLVLGFPIKALILFSMIAGFMELVFPIIIDDYFDVISQFKMMLSHER